MNSFLRNKRIMFPIIISLIVIVIAIIVFILIGINPGKKQRVAEIDLGSTSANSATNVAVIDENDNEDEDENRVLNNSENENDENGENEEDDDDENEIDDDDEEENNEEDEEIDFNGEEIYLNTANEFIDGLKDEEAMRSFIDNHLDIKAYIAYYNTNGEDSKFVEEYQNTDYDDEEAERIIENFTKLSGNDNVKLTALTEPRQSSDDDSINRITLTIKTKNELENIRMVFYDDVVIYIYDDNLDPVAEIH